MTTDGGEAAAEAERALALAVVVAVDAANGIGRGGGLPWRLPGDMAHFREVTTATADPDRRNAVVMGRRTWESIPPRFRPLRGRLNVVITRSSTFALPEGVLRAGSFDEALAMARAREEVETAFAIGGASVYREALGHPDCATVYWTRVEGTFECDTFVPPVEDGFERIEVSEEREEDGIRYRFEVWRRWGRT